MKPFDLLEAELIYRLCQDYHTLPTSGSVLEQPIGIVRMHAILREGGFFDDEGTGNGTPPPYDPLADLPMVVM